MSEHMRLATVFGERALPRWAISILAFDMADTVFDLILDLSASNAHYSGLDVPLPISR